MPTFLNSLLAFFQVFFVLVLTVSAVHGQKPPETLDEYQKSYERRIQKDFLLGSIFPPTWAKLLSNSIKDRSGNPKKNSKTWGRRSVSKALLQLWPLDYLQLGFL
jgi:hypothetical protein